MRSAIRVYDDVDRWTICPHGPLWAGADAYCPKHDLAPCPFCDPSKSNPLVKAVIRWHERVLAVGMTQSGKSELLRHLFEQVQVRRVLVDPKGEWAVPGVPRWHLRAGDEEAARAEVAAIDWDQPLIHVQPGYLQKAQLSALYARIWALPGEATVWTDERYAVSSASWAPEGLIALDTAGAGVGKGHYSASQRPRHIYKTGLTEVTHLFLFPPLDEDDIVESRRGLPFLSAPQALELAHDLPQHSYLWADRNERRVAIGDPLPAEYLSEGRIRRRASAR